MNRPVFTRWITIALLISLLSGCAYLSEWGQLHQRAKAAYSQADYDSAVFLIIQSLQKKPDYEKSQILVQDAFMMANRVHLDKIGALKASDNEFKYDELVREYQALVDLHRAIRNLPPIRFKKTGMLLEFKTVDYSAELSSATQSAAESHYQAALVFAAEESMDSQKAAAKEFKRALGFIPDYKDAGTRYESSRKAGVKRIAVFPFEDLSGKRKRYGAVEELVVDQMVNSVMKDASATEFLELISRDQLDRVIAEQKLNLSGLVNEETAVEVGAILGVHEIMTGKITQIIYTPVQDVTRDFKETGKVVVKTEKYKDKDGKTKTRNVYGDVEARVKQYTRTTKATIKGSYRIMDVKTAKLITTEAFEGNASFSADWATFTGDERALSYRTARMVKSGETLAPVAEEIISQAATDLANNLSATLKVYAR